MPEATAWTQELRVFLACGEPHKKEPDSIRQNAPLWAGQPLQSV